MRVVGSGGPALIAPQAEQQRDCGSGRQRERLSAALRGTESSSSHSSVQPGGLSSVQKVMFSCADADPLLSRGGVLPWRAAGPVAVRLDPCRLLAASLSAPQLLPSCPVLLRWLLSPWRCCCPLSLPSPMAAAKGDRRWLLAHSDPGLTVGSQKGWFFSFLVCAVFLCPSERRSQGHKEALPSIFLFLFFFYWKTPLFSR